MPVPAELTDLALKALEDEIECWHRMRWGEGCTRLVRFADEPNGISQGDQPERSEMVVYHDVPTHDADEKVLRLAMEKVVEAVISAISVVSPEAPIDSTSVSFAEGIL